jgi:hypothetical protein
VGGKGKGKARSAKEVKGGVRRTHTKTGVNFSNIGGPLYKLLKWFGEKKRVGVLRGAESGQEEKEK